MLFYNKKSTLWSLLVLTTVMMVILFVAARATQAGTYNFYFNNTEQGANSTAKPTVVVKDGKKDDSEEEEDTGEAEPLPTSTPTSPSPQKPSAKSADGESVAAYEPEARQGWRIKPSMFRIHGGYQATNSTYTYTTTTTSGNEFGSPNWSPFGSSTTSNTKQQSVQRYTGAVFEGSFHPVPAIAGTVFIGANYGAEFELIPIQNESVFELGGMVGIIASPIPAKDVSTSTSLSTKSAKGEEAAALHVGLKSSLFFNKHFGITGSYRTTLNSTKDNRLSLAMLDVGFTYRF